MICKIHVSNVGTTPSRWASGLPDCRYSTPKIEYLAVFSFRFSNWAVDILISPPIFLLISPFFYDLSLDSRNWRCKLNFGGIVNSRLGREPWNSFDTFYCCCTELQTVTNPANVGAKTMKTDIKQLHRKIWCKELR